MLSDSRAVLKASIVQPSPVALHRKTNGTGINPGIFYQHDWQNISLERTPMPPMSSLVSLQSWSFSTALDIGRQARTTLFFMRQHHFDRLWREGESTLVSGSGLDVGLPEGQMGNSEVGHMSFGSGESSTRVLRGLTKPLMMATSKRTKPIAMRSTRRSRPMAQYTYLASSRPAAFIATKIIFLQLRGSRRDEALRLFIFMHFSTEETHHLEVRRRRLSGLRQSWVH